MFIMQSILFLVCVLIVLLLHTPLVLLIEVGVHLHGLAHGAGKAGHLLAPQRPPHPLRLLAHHISKKSESRECIEAGSDVVSQGPARGLNPLEDDIFTKRLYCLIIAK